MTATALQTLADYAAGQKSTGLLLICDGRTVLERSWPLPAGSETFAAVLSKGSTADGAPREDVASQQKSVIALLCAIAEDRGLLEVTRPVADLIGTGWTKAGAAAEAAISVRHLLEMTSGLTEALEVEAPPGARFFYNTPAYARLQRVLEAAAGMSLEALSRAWLTGRLDMTDTAWAPRPAELARQSGNAWGLVTAPRDLAKLGRLLLDGGCAPDGTRVVSEHGLAAMLAPGAANPAYGRLWWLNAAPWSIRADGVRRDGPLCSSAPPDAVMALGAENRVLGVALSRRLILARLGMAAPDEDFIDQLWRRAMAAI